MSYVKYNSIKVKEWVRIKTIKILAQFRQHSSFYKYGKVMAVPESKHTAGWQEEYSDICLDWNRCQTSVYLKLPSAQHSSWDPLNASSVLQMNNSSPGLPLTVNMKMERSLKVHWLVNNDTTH